MGCGSKSLSLSGHDPYLLWFPGSLEQFFWHFADLSLSLHRKGKLIGIMRRLTMTFVLCVALTGNAWGVDVVKQLKYCHRQVERALKGMQPYHYDMQPRNILDGQTQWNCRQRD